MVVLVSSSVGTSFYAPFQNFKNVTYLSTHDVCQEYTIVTLLFGLVMYVMYYAL
jgi:hypothetical protein